MKKILNAFIYVSVLGLFAAAAIMLSSLYDDNFPDARISGDVIRLFLNAVVFPPLVTALYFRLQSGKYLAREARLLKLLPLRLGAAALAVTVIGYPLWFLIAGGDGAFPFRGFALAVLLAPAAAWLWAQYLYRCFKYLKPVFYNGKLKR